MQHVTSVALALILSWPVVARADEALTVAGHDIVVTSDGIWSATLAVDGVVLHENGLIFLDPQVQDLGGLAVVTGVAGAGGNACNAPPFVLALPEGGEPAFFGPVDSCANLMPSVEAETLVFASEPSPGYPGETWVWTSGKGFVAGASVEFTATAGWEAFDSLFEAHPADALAIAPVLDALQAGLGPDYPVYAERISDLGSGDLTPEGYLGQACIKFTCDTDWALLYLHRESQGIFAAWVATDDLAQHLWPADKTLWPAEALAALPAPVVDLPLP